MAIDVMNGPQTSTEIDPSRLLFVNRVAVAPAPPAVDEKMIAAAGRPTSVLSLFGATISMGGVAAAEEMHAVFCLEGLALVQAVINKKLETLTKDQAAVFYAAVIQAMYPGLPEGAHLEMLAGAAPMCGSKCPCGNAGDESHG